MNHGITLQGHTTAPTDMIEAARQSFADPANFEDLMRQTDGAAPTREQLVAAVERERRALTNT